MEVATAIHSQESPKQYLRVKTHCAICHQDLVIGIEREFLRQVEVYPFPHIILHGEPLHVMTAYLDAHLEVRGVEYAESIEIQPTHATFTQLVKKWSLPS